MVAILVIPISVLVTLVVMRLLDMSFNLMTLGGIAAAIGLIIDDAIVVVENLYTHIAAGMERRAAIELAVAEIATPIVGSVAAVSEMSHRPMPVFVVRKDVKKHGTMKLIEGLIPSTPSNVVIVDDVVTTGDSILKAIDAVTDVGHKVLLAISVLDRNAGAIAALKARGIPYHPLVTLSDIGVFDEPSRQSSEVGAH